MKKIILVDDSITILETVKLALSPLIEQGKIEFEARLDPAELLWDLLDEKTTYDLLISDINMPQMSGLELISIIKSEPKLMKKPIIVLSTESSKEMKERGREAGVLGWMVKPFDGERLRKTVKLITGI